MSATQNEALSKTVEELKLEVARMKERNHELEEQKQVEMNGPRCSV